MPIRSLVTNPCREFCRAALIAAGLLALVSSGARAATARVDGPAAATPGGVVTVQVALSPDLDAVYAIQGAVSYDPAVLTLLEPDTAPQGFHPGAAPPFLGETIPKDADLFRMNPTAPGRVVFAYVKNPSQPAGSPAVAVPPVALSLSFQVAEGAAGTTQVGLVPYAVNGRDLPAVLLGDRAGAPIAAQAATPLSIVLTLRGDANGDGAVTMADVLLALRAAGGGALLEGEALRADNADVWPPGAPDGAVTLEDALRIARFVNGLENDLN